MADGITIQRVFDSPRKRVWEVWTDPELVKKWWGPKDFTAPSIKIDFKEGGKYIYCMHGPKGSEWDKDLYSAGVYKEIVPEEKLVATDYFSDEYGNKVDPSAAGMEVDMPSEMNVIVRFEDEDDNKTRLTIEYPLESDEEREALLKSGMEEGWNQSLDKLNLTL